MILYIVVQWGNLSAFISSYLADHAPTLGDMNIIMVKAREYLMDSHIGMYIKHSLMFNGILMYFIYTILWWEAFTINKVS